MRDPLGNNLPRIAVLAGGCSPEREVSLASGVACAEALAEVYPVDLFCVNAETLPDGLDPALHVVFSTLHGGFGENGGMQALLEAAGVEYTGCDAPASALLMDKGRTKDRVAQAGLPVAPDVRFMLAEDDGLFLIAQDVVTAISRRDLLGRLESLGAQCVIKPLDAGSSIGLQIVREPVELERSLARLGRGSWLAEPRLAGHDVSIGVLTGAALGLVEILPESEVYDYTAKYKAGSTQYRFPAEVPDACRLAIEAHARQAFVACGCRDYIRIDWMLDSDGNYHFLEVNTLPGMTPTSLLPKSASCRGYSFVQLLQAMLSPAIDRFNQRLSTLAQGDVS